MTHATTRGNGVRFPGGVGGGGQDGRVRTLLKILVVLVVLAVGADRAADYVAERIVASEIEKSEDLQARPDVDITGFPFLTQLARRQYDEVRVSAPTVQVGPAGRRLELRSVRVDLRDVRTSSDLRRFTAAGARATGTVPYAELSRLTGLRIRYGGQGEVRAGKRIEVLGQSFDPTVTVTPRLLDGAVTLGSELAQGTSSLPPAVASGLRDALGVRVPLTGLPFGVRPTSVRATPGGLRVRLVASALSYP